MALEPWKKAADTARRGGQLIRIARAAKQVGKASNDLERDRARSALAALLRDARGIPMKVGQFLSQGEGGEAYDALRSNRREAAEFPVQSARSVNTIPSPFKPGKLNSSSLPYLGWGRTPSIFPVWPT